ncbi:MAG TPA: DciA family protein [Candidatus Moranbacteria bacterium]|nr:DciA family protein [Candidatus Moranbacteria bacterium]
MKSLKNLLYKREKKKSIALTDKDIFYIFSKIIKEEFGNVGAEKLKADYFKNKTIFVRSSSSAWASELFSNRNTIIRKINKELGEGEIREIKMK